jgi:surfeit locus 1 family protein
MQRRKVRIVPLILLTGATLTFVALGTWQLSRLRERRAANAVALAQRALPAVSLNDSTRVAPQRSVRATGRWDYTHEVVLRGQSRRDAPGVTIATPLLLDRGDVAVLIVRGFAPAPDAMTVRLDSLREGERASISGLALRLESLPDSGVPLVRNGLTTWRSLDSAAVASRVPYPLLGVYVVAEGDSSSGKWPRRVEPPAITDGPHLSYALQWFGFAVITVVGGILWLRKR